MLQSEVWEIVVVFPSRLKDLLFLFYGYLLKPNLKIPHFFAASVKMPL